MESKRKDKASFLASKPLLVGLGSLSLLLLGIGFWRVSQFANPQKNESVVVMSPIASIKVITALGRLSPKGEIINISSSSLSEGARIEELRVEEGDRVKKGDILAVLDGRDRLQAIVEQIKKDVKVKEAELAKINAGAKAGEIVAQEGEITKLEAQLFRQIQGAQARLVKLESQLKRNTEAQEAQVAQQKAKLQRETEGQEAKIAQLKAQLRGEDAAQKVTIGRLQVEFNTAESEFKRHAELKESGAISASLYDTKKLTMESAKEKVKEAQENLKKTQQTLQEQINEANSSLQRIMETGNEQVNEAEANLKRIRETSIADIDEAKASFQQILETGQEQINQAKATLNKITEIRPTDVQSAQAALNSAIASQKKAETDLSFTYVKAPFSGQVIKINNRQGERVNNQNGILQLGRTDQMYVIAEVYETDINKVRLQQRATIESENGGFPGQLKGKVDQIGLKIGKKDVLENDPTADKDARVVEVKIRIDPEDSRKVSGLTNLQVRVKINVDNP